MGVGIAIGVCVVCCYCRKKKKRRDSDDMGSKCVGDDAETAIPNGVSYDVDSSSVKINMTGSNHDFVVFGGGETCNNHNKQSELPSIAGNDTGIMLYIDLNNHGRECCCKSTQTDDGGILQ